MKALKCHCQLGIVEPWQFPMQSFLLTEFHQTERRTTKASKLGSTAKAKHQLDVLTSFSNIVEVCSERC